MKRGLFLLIVPLAGLVLLAGGLLFNRSTSPSPVSSLVSSLKPSPEGISFPSASVAPNPAALRPSPSSAPTVLNHDHAADRARAINAYRNYRTAIATENEDSAASMLGLAGKDRAVWLDLAKADLSAATTAFDTAIAQKIVETLGRKP